MSRRKRWFRDDYRTALWKPNALRPNEVLVGLAYAEYAGSKDDPDSDLSWVAWTTLSDMTGIRSKATISSAIKGLVNAGWMTQIEPARQHRSPRYRLTIPDKPEVRHLYLCDPPADESSGSTRVPLSPDPEVQNMNT